MFPPRESDVAQLPCPPTDVGHQTECTPTSSDAAADTAAEDRSRWQVIGALPDANCVPPPAAEFARAVDTIYGAAADPSVAGAPPPVATVPDAVAAGPTSSTGPVSREDSAATVSPSATVTAAAAASATAGEDLAVCPGSSRLGDVPCWLVSLIFHLAALLVLALIPGWRDEPQRGSNTALRFEDHSLDALVETDEPQLDEVDLTSLDVAETQMVEAADSGDVLDGIGMDNDPMASDLEALLSSNEQDAMVMATSDQLLKVATGSDLSGRGMMARGQLIRSGGGTAASEEAVALALKWIVAHQAKDGGWNFDHQQGSTCDGRCRGTGNARAARNGATAMALLPLLGAGNTHKSGRYRENVDRGLRFLMLRQDKKTGSFHEPQGDMYSHGLAAIALCEAYAMTKDRALHDHAQGSLEFIATAQDPVGGGWRYAPRQTGDTSVVGWQMMALKSGLMGYLNVPPKTIKLAERFLDHVQDGDGSRYGYTDSGGEPATTSIGLLCRMYTGWRRERPALLRGVEYIGKTGPSDSNMYYNYYATQVVHHYGGEAWREWNAKMRDSLVESQEKTGHATGSWYMRDRFVTQGGRLYCTAMAAMILEVYYRHLPIYRQESVNEHFRSSE
ncbi:MAG: prenyltransferase/squalene oxidase repeat-containing protein [Pirellulales bacterium]